MNFSRIIIILLVGTAVVFCASARDTVVLKNGDILTGEILEEAPGHVYFKTAAFGSVSLQPKDIEEIRFETREHGEISTTPATKGSAADEEVGPPNPADFVGPLPQAEPPVKKAAESKWSGQAGLAVAMRESIKSDANGVTGTDQSDTYRFYGNIDWEKYRNRLSWNWTYRYSRDEYEKQDDFFNLTQNYTYNFQANYYATVKTMYQQDYRRQIDHEYLQTAEMGIKWTTYPEFELATSAGAGYHLFDRVTYNSATRSNQDLNVGETKFIFDESLRWRIINSLTLIQKYTHLGDFTKYHFVFTAGLENKLIQDVFLRLEYRLDRDTEVFYDDRGYYDKALLTSLLYKF